MRIEKRKGAFLLIEQPIRLAIAVHAIRNRDHPEWSQLKCDMREAA